MMRRAGSPRSRLIVAGCLLAVVGLGLASRAFAEIVPAFVAANAGDALWTVAVYLSLALLFPKAMPLWLGAAALGISVAVELSQLVDLAWLNALRATLPGRLLLGAGFLWADLGRYLVGAVGATALDALWLGRRRSASSRRRAAVSAQVE